MEQQKQNQEQQKKKGKGGRPKGSKNKPKVKEEEQTKVKEESKVKVEEQQQEQPKIEVFTKEEVLVLLKQQEERFLALLKEQKTSNKKDIDERPCSKIGCKTKCNLKYEIDGNPYCFNHNKEEMTRREKEKNTKCCMCEERMKYYHNNIPYCLNHYRKTKAKEESKDIDVESVKSDQDRKEYLEGRKKLISLYEQKKGEIIKEYGTKLMGCKERDKSTLLSFKRHDLEALKTNHEIELEYYDKNKGKEKEIIDDMKCVVLKSKQKVSNLPEGNDGPSLLSLV